MISPQLRTLHEAHEGAEGERGQFAPMTQRKRRVRSNTPPFDSASAKRAVLKVGEGLGFVIEFVQPSPNTKGLSKLHDLPPFDLPPFFRSRFIVTAAHCLPSLPSLPPSRSLLYPHAKTY